MNILRVIASLDPRQGGPVEGLLNTTALMAQWGHHTEILTLDPPSAPYLPAVGHAVHATGPNIGKFGFNGRLTPWIRRNAHRFDVAVLHGLWNYAPIGAWRGLAGGELPYVQFTHGMLDPWFNSVQPIKRWAKQALWLLAQGRVLHDAKTVLFTSEEEGLRARTAFIGHSYAGRVVAYGAADIPDQADEQRAAFAGKAPQLNARPYLLYLGRLHPKKGCDLLIRSFAKIAAQHSHLDLVMAGPDEGGTQAQLQVLAAENGIADRLHWPGLLQGSAKWGAYRDATAFVLPSHQENFGMAVAEALASGTPVLISDKINIWREVAASAAGLIEPDTLEGTHALLTRFLALQPQEQASIGRLARACYEKQFSLDEAARDLLRVLEWATETAR